MAGKTVSICRHAEYLYTVHVYGLILVTLLGVVPINTIPSKQWI